MRINTGDAGHAVTNAGPRSNGSRQVKQRPVQQMSNAKEGIRRKDSEDLNMVPLE